MSQILRNTTTGRIIAQRVKRARSLWMRTKGFLFRNYIPMDEGLWFENCRAIHTVGMRVPIDVVFLDRDNRIVRIVPAAPVSRFAIACRAAAKVLELGNGGIAFNDLLVGDHLALE